MTREYHPDAWVILEISSLKEKKSVRKIFSSYNDEFGVPATWTLNSGIVKALKLKNAWKLTGKSGSIYYCNINNYAMNTLMKVTLNSWRKNNISESDLIIDIIELKDIKKI